MVLATLDIPYVLNAAQPGAQPLAPWGYWYQDRHWRDEDGRPVPRQEIAQRLAVPELVLLAWEFRAR